MFFLLEQSFLVFDKDYLYRSNQTENNWKQLLVYDLLHDNRSFVDLNWIQLDSKISHDSVAFICGTFSKQRKLLAVADNKKNVVIYDCNFQQIGHFQTKKIPIKLIFNKNEDSIFVCDKSGDIYEYNIKNFKDSSEKLLLGHCSMLLDFIITPDQNYIIR